MTSRPAWRTPTMLSWTVPVPHADRPRGNATSLRQRPEVAPEASPLEIVVSEVWNWSWFSVWMWAEFCSDESGSRRPCGRSSGETRRRRRGVVGRCGRGAWRLGCGDARVAGDPARLRGRRCGGRVGSDCVQPGARARGGPGGAFVFARGSGSGGRRWCNRLRRRDHGVLGGRVAGRADRGPRSPGGRGRAGDRRKSRAAR